MILQALFSDRNLLADILQTVERLVQRLVLLREVQTDQVIHRLTEEARAGHRADAHVAREHLAELEVGVKAELGDIEQDVIRALRVGVRDADVLKPLEEEVALVRVLVLQPLVVRIRHMQTRHGSLLQRRGGADRQEIVYLLCRLDDLRRRDDIAQTPAGDGVGLGQRAARERALPHAGQGREVGMLVGGIDDVLIDLVGDDIDVVLLRKVGDDLQLIIGEHLAAGVRGVAEDHGLRVLAEGGLELVDVEVELRRIQRHIDRLRAGEDRIRAVVLIERGEDHDLVAGVGDGHHRGHHGLGTAAGDDDLAVRVDLVAHQAGLLRGERLAEVLRAPGDGVLVEVLVRYLRETVGDLLGRLKVGEALRQVDRAVAQGHARHPADDGIGEVFCSDGKFLHKISS